MSKVRPPGTLNGDKKRRAAVVNAAAVHLGNAAAQQLGKTLKQKDYRRYAGESPKKVIGNSLRVANAQARKPKLKTAPDVGTGRIMLYLRSRFNPIRMLTPELLSVYLDRFEVGYLRELALVWDSIEKRDDKVALVRPLRMKGVARLGYQVELVDGLDDADKAQAEQHKAALESFYANATATSAIDENDRGGVKKLIKQMMDAVGKRYSVHEIVWQPKADGSLGAEFRWTPLWFFENTTGTPALPADRGPNLRRAARSRRRRMDDHRERGADVRHVHRLHVQDAAPARLGDLHRAQRDAGLPGQDELAGELGQLQRDGAGVAEHRHRLRGGDQRLGNHRGGGSKRQPGRAAVRTAGEAHGLGHRGAVARWRSQHDVERLAQPGHGSNRQEDEAEIILDDDIEMINETLNQQVDKIVIEYLFGDDQPLAKFQIIRPPKEATAQDIAVDEFLIGSLPQGQGLSVDDTLKRYARNAAKPGEPMMVAPAQPEQIPAGLGNERVLKGRVGDPLFRTAMRQLTSAQAAELRPLLVELKAAADGDDAGLKTRIGNVAAKIPALLARINVDPTTAKVIEKSLVAEFFNGRISGPPKP